MIKNLYGVRDNPTVATVDQTGKITANSAGEAVITVTTTNNKTASCVVVVTKKPVPIESVDK
ncbi:MAG: Ig-like domain-containing protein [Thomasclavelia sp.]